MKSVSMREIQFYQRSRKSMTDDVISAALGRRHTGAQLRSAYQAHRDRAAKRSRKVYIPSKHETLGLLIEDPPTIAPAALADWEKRCGLHPADLTALVCGDPLPGYSALDRRRSA